MALLFDSNGHPFCAFESDDFVSIFPKVSPGQLLVTYSGPRLHRSGLGGVFCPACPSWKGHSRKGLHGKSAVGRLGCLSVSLLHLSSYMTGHWHEWILAWCALAFHSAETVVIESRRHLDL